MENNDRPKLTVVKGGKGRTGNRTTPSGLTEKQERFAQCLAEGMTLAEAYRQSYDCSTMALATIHNEAAKLGQHHGITARVNALLDEKGRRNSMGALKREDRVWRGVWRLAEGENVPPSVQQAALALAAKMAGMLTDSVKIESVSGDSSTIEKELLERLQRLGKTA